MNLRLKEIQIYSDNLNNLPNKKLLINTINAHCYNIAQKDKLYAEALHSSDVLLPDGISVIIAKRILQGNKLSKIAGADLFYYEMNRLNHSGGKCFFLGSKISTLELIKNKAKKEFPNVQVAYYSPPYVHEFSKKDNKKILQEINQFEPDVLFIGMTAPKQEKWAYLNYNEIISGHICSIGAVFDFYAGNINRAPKLMIKLGFEWLYRLIKEPKRLWPRYIIGNIVFIYSIFIECFLINSSSKNSIN
jgi:N-acetylglucosaminyldiphosphoundecaprenol N-acetyl-beta-D-mannosaminyltransferase